MHYRDWEVWDDIIGDETLVPIYIDDSNDILYSLFSWDYQRDSWENIKYWGTRKKYRKDIGGFEK